MQEEEPLLWRWWEAVVEVASHTACGAPKMAMSWNFTLALSSATRPRLEPQPPSHTLRLGERLEATAMSGTSGWGRESSMDRTR